MKKILITGSNGLIGQKLTSILRTLPGVELTAVSRGPNRMTRKSGYKYEELDLTDNARTAQVISQFRPDTIIHTAAMTQVDLCEREQDRCWQINTLAVETLVRAAEKIKAHLIHFSTDFIFDGKSGPYREDSQPHPVNFYGRSKLRAEEIVSSAELPWTIIRTILVYGVPENKSRSNIILWIVENLRAEKKIRVVSDQWRMPTLAEDLAEACAVVAEKKAEGLFHVSGDEMMSICDLAYRTADYFKLDKGLIEPVETASLHEAAARPPKTGFILEKAKKVLRYRPRRLEDGLSLVKNQLDELSFSK